MNKELPIGSTLSHYRIVSKIGAGGMGEVYLAQDTKLDRKVALKILPAELASNRDRMERFVREAKSAAALNHPNIATIHEIGKSDEVNFIAMEFIDGATLREKIHREGTELRKLLRYLQHVAEGLAKAHAAGIVHRDLKPDNVMVTHDGHAKILDFGLAKLIEGQDGETGGLGDAETRGHGDGETQRPGDEGATLIAASPRPLVPASPLLPVATSPGLIMGTVGYMSPEQAQGKTNEIDQRSDIFSFGCILYEAATGKKPFEGDSVLKSLHMVVYEQAPPIADINPAAPAELQRIVRRCLEKDPDDRYQGIREVAIELKHLRRELETSPDFDTTVPPPVTGESALSTSSGSTIAPTATVSSPTPSAVSSAEYVAQSVKRNKVAVAIVLLAVIVAGAVFVYLRSGKTDTAIDSIAVLPFENKSNATDTDYLSDGLTESLIYRLSQLPNLKVSPTSSVMYYKGKGGDLKTVAAELGVRAIMTGRVVQRGDSLTISVELVDVTNNKSLWGEQYERKMSDLLTTQRDIAASITQKLQLKLSGNETGLTKKYTDNNEAYQLYLKGRFYWNKRDEENLKKAIEQFKAAADKDPNYALAYVGLADSYVLLPYYSGATSAEVTPPAKAYAERALQIDKSLGEAHTALGYVNRLLWNWAEAEKELKRGVELNPDRATAHKFYGNVLFDLGRFDEARAEYTRAQELEPLSLIISANLTESYLQSGELDAAAAQCQRAIDLDPNWYYARMLLAFVYLKQGKNVEALTEAEKSVESSKRLSGPLAALGGVYARTGKRNEAEALVKELKEKFARRQANGYDIARLYVWMGDKDQAFEWLDKDFQSRNATLPNFLSTSPLISLHDDPRFKDLTRRVGLPDLK
jgi:serine/threonine protein kinase/tetratricopeptide (TPR) repeat protein